MCKPTNAYTQKLLFGENAEVITSGRAKTAQSLGGTGALRIAAEFIKRHTSAKKRFGFLPQLGQTTMQL